MAEGADMTAGKVWAWMSHWERWICLPAAFWTLVAEVHLNIVLSPGDQKLTFTATTMEGHEAVYSLQAHYHPCTA